MGNIIRKEVIENKEDVIDGKKVPMTIKTHSYNVEIHVLEITLITISLMYMLKK